MFKINEILANGGGTFSMNGGTLPTFGYMVSLKGTDNTVSTESSFILYAILRYVGANAHILKDNNFYLGLWVNGTILTMDVSFNIQDLKTATFLGQLNEQIAIYDIANEEMIAI